MPRSAPGKASISPAMTSERPVTLQMPSESEATRPV